MGLNHPKKTKKWPNFALKRVFRTFFEHYIFSVFKICHFWPFWPILAKNDQKWPIFEKSNFSKIGPNRLQDRFGADLGLKFGFCVKNCIGTSVQTSISSFFENLVFYKSGFWLFFSFKALFRGPGASKSNAA